MKKHHIARLEAGLCVYCGESPPADGRRGCKPCLGFLADKQARRRAKGGRITYTARKAAGVCTMCGEVPPEPGKVCCRPCLDRQKETARRSWEKLKAEVFEVYGNACACCGESEPVFLSLDHVNGDGSAERIALNGENRGAREVYRIARRQGFPDRFRLLCRNCNWAYHVLGACPHGD